MQGGPFKFASITLTPIFDGPREMKAYSKRLSVERDNWRFASGEPVKIKAMLEQLDLEVVYGDRPRLDVLHETDIFVLSPASEHIERFEGIPLDHDGIELDFLK